MRRGDAVKIGGNLRGVENFAGVKRRQRHDASG
jgi:hypothetical protein